MLALVLALFLLQAGALDDGLKALDAKDYPAAIAAFEKAASADPKDYAARFHLALAYSLAGDHEKAIGAYRETLGLKPGLYEASMNLAALLMQTAKPADAITLLEHAIESKPTEFRPRFFLGLACLRAGQLDQAQTRLNEARRLNPASAPELDSALLELAAAFEKARQLPRAIAIYGEFPNNVGARERMGELLLETSEPEQAAAQLEAAVKLAPSAANRYALATAYLRSQQSAKATQMMEEAVAADTNNPELRIAYGGLLRDQRNFQGAAQQFWAATKLKPDSRDAWSGLATMLLSLENYVQAIAAFDKLEALGDPNPGLHFLRALAYDKTKQYKPALAGYQKFLAAAAGKFPDEEFKARQRVKVIEKELSHR